MTGTVTDSKSFVWDTLSAVPLLLSDGEFEFIYGTGTAPFAQVEIATGDVTFLHGDYVGSTRTATNMAGDVVGEWDYSLYGVVTQVSGSVGVTDFLFAGERQDESGMYYLRNRYYDPVTASFISVDPILGATGMPYAYTAGNPLQGTDPLGLYSFGDLWDDVSDVSAAVWEEVSSPEFIASTLTFTACAMVFGVATLGLGVAACGALAGAVYGAVSYAQLPFECQSWGGFFMTVGLGAVFGAGGGLLGGAVGVVGGRFLTPWFQSVTRPIINRVIPQAVQNTLRMPVTQVAQGLKNRVSNLLRPNSANPGVVTPAVRAKVPQSWGAGAQNKANAGWHWADPTNPVGNTIRVNPGKPSGWPSQQVPYVKINSGGTVIGDVGQMLPNGSLPQAHIPLSDWMQWSTWHSP